MKLTRALLLSSKKQAHSWEIRPRTGIFLWCPKMYRYLVALGDEKSLRFQVYCVHYTRNGEPLKDGDCVVSTDQEIVAEYAHVDEFFGDVGSLHNFLHRYQIDFNDAWMPVED